MKNVGCNFHALQVNQTIKFFPRKSNQKGCVPHVASKDKGNFRLKFAACCSFRTVQRRLWRCCLIDRKIRGGIRPSAISNSSMPVLSVAGAIAVPVLLLIAGLMGHARADRLNSMKPCFFWALLPASSFFSMFCTKFSPAMRRICRKSAPMFLDLVLPVLYTFCAWLNWRHKGDDTPKAADADPHPLLNPDRSL